MRGTLTLFLVAVTAAPAVAQTAFDTDRNQAVGGLAGLASGSGIAYQEIFPSAFGYRGALALWSVGDAFFIDVGASGLRVLQDDGRRRLYLVGSLAYWRHTEEETEPIFDDGDNVVGERVFDDVDDSWSLGVGIGTELPIGRRTAVSLEALFTYWAESGDVLPLPQIGLQYQF